jgi:hypothetical protein
LPFFSLCILNQSSIISFFCLSFKISKISLISFFGFFRRLVLPLGQPLPVFLFKVIILILSDRFSFSQINYLRSFLKETIEIDE